MLKNSIVFDTSSPNTSFLIQWNNKPLVLIDRKIKFGSCEIAAWLDKAIKQHKLNLNKFNSLVICSGPGSFTGLRVGFSLAKGLNLGIDLPVIMVPAFLAMAWQVRNKAETIAVVTDARKNLAYAATYAAHDDKLKQTKKEHLCVLADFIKANPKCLYITYDKNIREQALKCNAQLNFYNKDIFPRAKSLLECARWLCLDKKVIKPAQLVPMYLHSKTCQIRK